MTIAPTRSRLSIATPPASAVRLRLSVHHDWDSLADVEREWDALAERSGADISACPALARVWWRHYGRGRLRVFCAWAESPFGEGERLAGVLPMFLESVRGGPVRVRLARLLGSDSTITVARPAIESACAAQVYRMVVAHLLSVDSCDAVHFGPLQGDGDAGGCLRGMCGTESADWNGMERHAGVCTRFDLPASFDRYLASLEKSERANLRRNMNKLARAPGYQVRVVTDPAEVEAAFDDFARMHTSQWRAEGRPGHFGDWPGSLDFSREAVRALAPLGRVALIGIEIGGSAVCAYWCFLLGDRCYWRLPARAVGDSWDQFGLGRVGLVTMLGAMIDRGVGYVEGGPGHYEYKTKHGATEHPLSSFVFVRNSRVTRLKVRWLWTFADSLHLAYYRGWRLKIAPALGVRTGPLWRCWTRTRL